MFTQGQDVIYTGSTETQRNYGSGTGNYNDLVLNKCYTVEHVDIGSWSTAIWLEGVQHSFNSVCFQSVEDYFEEQLHEKAEDPIFKVIIHPYNSIGKIIRMPQTGADNALTSDEELMIALQQKILELQTQVDYLSQFAPK